MTSGISVEQGYITLAIRSVRFSAPTSRYAPIALPRVAKRRYSSCSSSRESTNEATLWFVGHMTRLTLMCWGQNLLITLEIAV